MFQVLVTIAKVPYQGHSNVQKMSIFSPGADRVVLRFLGLSQVWLHQTPKTHFAKV